MVRLVLNWPATLCIRPEKRWYWVSFDSQERNWASVDLYGEIQPIWAFASGSIAAAKSCSPRLELSTLNRQ